MGYSALIKIGLWLALIGACAGAVLWVCSIIYSKIYDAGRNDQIVICQENEIARQKELEKAVGEAMRSVAKQKKKELSALMGAIEHGESERKKIADDLANMRTNSRLWIDSKVCAGNPDGKGEIKDPGDDGGGTGRIRLPGEIEQDLWEYAAAAQTVVMQYNRLRQACMPFLEIE